MQSASPSSSLHPAFLPAGTQVGPWRVVDWAGQGVHGAVYRAVRIGQEHTPPVALKLALIPEDPRFARERELLSRALHPHIPRLVDHGSWESPSGSRHPFLAMEWVDGVPLYDWGRLFRPTAAQQLRLLAQVALTLQYLHAQDAFHRDLKGGNVLVRRCDSRVFLTDFGSGIYPDADTLTPQQLPPGTPAYRMLSLRPEQRGTAAQLTQALEHAADSLTHSSPPPGASGTEQTAVRTVEASAPNPRAPVHSRQPWLALAAAAAGALAMWATWMTWAALPRTPEGPPLASQTAHPTAKGALPDAEPVGLGEAAASAATSSPDTRSATKPLAEDSLPEPSEGQEQPDKKGRCPHPRQVILNGSCWARMELNSEKCEIGGGQMYQGACYVPIFPRGHKRPNTSSPGTPR